MNQVLSVQYLRGIAAIMVVWHHTKIQVPAYEHYIPGSFGASGVDIFFVISGFIMLITTFHSETNAKDFLAKRIIRVAPLYWLLTLTMVLVWLIFPAMFKVLIVMPEALVKSLLFIPHYSLSYKNDIFPLLVPGWTLNFEMFFYLLISLTLLVERRVGVRTLLLTILILVLIGEVSTSYTNPLYKTYTSPMLLEFGTGIVLGLIWIHKRTFINPLSSMMIFIAGWILLVINSELSFSKYMTITGATFIVLGALYCWKANYTNKYLRLIGDASYSIYLTHIFTLGIIRFIWIRWIGVETSNVSALAFAIISQVCSIYVGVVVYLKIEKHVTKKLTAMYFSTNTRGY